MAAASTGLDIEQTFHGSPAQEQLLNEIRALQRLADLVMEGAEAMTALSLKAFAIARDGDPRANGPGTEFLDCAERLFGEAKALRSEAEALWRRLEE